MAETKHVVAIVGGGCGVLLLAACCFAAAGMYYCKTSWDESDAAAHEFLRMLREGEVDEAYARMSKQYRARTPLEKFEAELRANPALTEHGDVAITQHNFQPDATQVGGALFTDEGPTAFQMVITDPGGDWRIESLSVRPGGPQTGPQAGPQAGPEPPAPTAPDPPPLPDSLKGDAN